MRTTRWQWSTITFRGLAFFAGLICAVATAHSVNQGWVEAHKVKLRLLAGGSDSQNTQQRLAFLEMRLDPGWKTYWRHPGDGGGIPPEFNWERSENLRAANVLFPAPQRLKDQIGDTIGYKGRVVFPVILTPKTSGAPIKANVSIRFGICKDICVPLDVDLSADVLAQPSQTLPLDVTAAQDMVPRTAQQRQPGDPRLATVDSGAKRGDDWVIRLESEHQAGATARDLFVEAPDGLFVPVPKPTADTGTGRAAYEVLLRDDEFQALRGQTLRATIVDSQGSSEMEFTLEK